MNEQRPPKQAPRSASDFRTLARQAHVKGELAQAKRLYNRHLLDHPDDPQVWTNLGVLYRSEHRHDRALAAQRLAYRINPTSRVVRNNYANILDDVGEHGEAIGLRRELVAENPTDPEQSALLVRSHRAAGDLAQAERVAREALDRLSGHPKLRFQLGLTQLTAGDHRDGFANYLARWDDGSLTLPEAPAPRWQGEQLDGRSILVLPEQGFGDTLNFARFLPFLKAQGAVVHCQVRPPLRRLFAPGDAVDVVHDQVSRKDRFDCWVSIMDIPAFYFRDHQSVPGPLRVVLPADSAERAARIVAAYRDHFKVGVAWTGSPGYDRNTMRSLDHGMLLDLVDIPGVQLFSLYKGKALDAYVDDGTASFILDAAGSDRDLADCAALIAELDLVITIDTVTAHVAGAVGTEVWNLLHWEPFWLYGVTGEKTEWYPTMRLLRQASPRDWASVLDRVKNDLQARVSSSLERRQ